MTLFELVKLEGLVLVESNGWIAFGYLGHVLPSGDILSLEFYAQWR